MSKPMTVIWKAQGTTLVLLSLLAGGRALVMHPGRDSFRFKVPVTDLTFITR